MEHVSKSHNFSAILRNCDAAGVLEAHVVPGSESLPLHETSSASARRWVAVRRHGSLDEALDALSGLRVLAAHPDPAGTDYREVDFTPPTAVLVGAELHGLSDAALEAADELVRIPMEGLVRSLNVSVATALLLFEARRQREAAGLYERSRLPPDRYERLLFEWAYPRIARQYREKGEPYPTLGQDGELRR